MLLVIITDSDCLRHLSGSRGLVRRWGMSELVLEEVLVLNVLEVLLLLLLEHHVVVKVLRGGGGGRHG